MNVHSSYDLLDGLGGSSNPQPNSVYLHGFRAFVTFISSSLAPFFAQNDLTQWPLSVAGSYTGILHAERLNIFLFHALLSIASVRHNSKCGCESAVEWMLHMHVSILLTSPGPIVSPDYTFCHAR